LATLEYIIYIFYNEKIYKCNTTKIKLMEIDENFEVFYAEIVNTANCLRITVPKQIVDGACYKSGDKVKVWLRKVNSEDSEEERFNYE